MTEIAELRGTVTFASQQTLKEERIFLQIVQSKKQSNTLCS